jgi:RNA polymerase sigma factor (sigma-70 family)
MADEPNEIVALIERVIQGDEQAITELYDKYHKALILIIRYRLNRSPRLRTLFDSIDLLQEVWEDVLAQPEKLRDFATFEAFFKHLARMAHHKVEKAQRKYSAQKRDLRRRRHLSDPGVAAVAAAAADPRPDPAQQAASHDTLVRWLFSLPWRQRRVVLRLGAGYSYQEIAAELACSERTIERMVAKIRHLPPPVPLPYL